MEVKAVDIFTIWLMILQIVADILHFYEAWILNIRIWTYIIVVGGIFRLIYSVVTHRYTDEEDS